MKAYQMLNAKNKIKEEQQKCLAKLRSKDTKKKVKAKGKAKVSKLSQKSLNAIKPLFTVIHYFYISKIHRKKTTT